jgi:lysyl-tRNA synthetase class II
MRSSLMTRISRGETPVLQLIPGGAARRPFTTTTLDMPLHCVLQMSCI